MSATCKSFHVLRGFSSDSCSYFLIRNESLAIVSLASDHPSDLTVRDTEIGGLKYICDLFYVFFNMHVVKVLEHSLLLPVMQCCDTFRKEKTFYSPSTLDSFAHIWSRIICVLLDLSMFSLLPVSFPYCKYCEILSLPCLNIN